MYTTAFGVEEAVDWGDDFWTLHGDMRRARDEMMAWVNFVRRETRSDSVVMALTSPTNWRKGVAEDYKANRKNIRKPMLLPAMRDFITSHWPTVIYDGLEADDVLGLMSGEGDILVSSDKDLLSVPGHHFNPDKPDDGVIVVDEVTAFTQHMTQTLTGDSTDNYKGCPKVGKVGAAKILFELTLEEMWPAVVGRFEKAGLTEEDALQQARLAHILHPGEYNHDTKEVTMWRSPYNE
jgi:DNA polymerase-1